MKKNLPKITDTAFKIVLFKTYRLTMKLHIFITSGKSITQNFSRLKFVVEKKTG